MKTIYITSLLLLGAAAYAQENKQVPPAEDQTKVLKQAKEQEAKLTKTAPEKSEYPKASTGLVSDLGPEARKQEAKTKTTADHPGKLLPNTASLDEIKQTIPNRQGYRSAATTANPGKTPAGLPNTATLQEIKKTIPKN